VGVLPVRLTAEGRGDPVFRRLPAQFPTLQWHGDTFDLPPGATLLASSPAYPNQAFRFGQRAYGVQFHVEVTEPMAAEWAGVPAYGEYAERVLGEGGIDRLMADFRASQAEMRSLARSMFEAWVELAAAVPG
jgi:GMP synthase-like glutamine amidotransferase